MYGSQPAIPCSTSLVKATDKLIIKELPLILRTEVALVLNQIRQGTHGQLSVDIWTSSQHANTRPLVVASDEESQLAGRSQK